MRRLCREPVWLEWEPSIWLELDGIWISGLSLGLEKECDDACSLEKLQQNPR